MSSLKREDLLGYVLGALDAQEQQRIQQLIDQDAKLSVSGGDDGDLFVVDAVTQDCESPDCELLGREHSGREHLGRVSIEDQLLAIKNSLAPLELIDTPLGPPPGLARRTCQWIAANERSGLLPRPQTFESASELLLQQVADDRENYWITAPGGQIADRPTGLDGVSDDVGGEQVTGDRVPGDRVTGDRVTGEKIDLAETGDRPRDALISGRTTRETIKPTTTAHLPADSTSPFDLRGGCASSSAAAPFEPTVDNPSASKRDTGKYDSGGHSGVNSRRAEATANHDSLSTDSLSTSRGGFASLSSRSEVSSESNTDLRVSADAILNGSHVDASLSRGTAELNAAASLPVARLQSGAARPVGRGAWQTADRLISRSTLSLTEMVALCTAALVVGSLLLPTLSLARFQSRVGACQENMLSLHRALMNYAVSNPLGEYVRVFDHQKLPYVGNYAVVLNDFGFLEKAQSLRCPGLGDDRAATPIDLTNAVALKADCSNSSEFVMNGGLGDYGYTMGVKNEKGKPMGVKPQMPNRLALVADSPSCREADRRSLNHEGRGQNTLYNDGSIGFRRDVVRGVDHLYLNDAWTVDNGLHSADSVIAPPHYRNVSFSTSE